MYFSATWCIPCKTFKPVVQQVAGELGVQILYVDVDQQKEIALKYGITSVPTIVVENNGSVVYRNSGIMSKGQLTNIMNQFR